MNGSEFIEYFDQYYDKITNLAAPGYNDAEKLRFLNSAQEEFVKKRFEELQDNPPASGEHRRREADLDGISNLDNPGTIAAIDNVKNGQMALLPDDCLFVHTVYSAITRTYPTMYSSAYGGTPQDGWVKHRWIHQKDLHGFAQHGNKKVYFLQPVSYLERNYVHTYYDSYVTLPVNASDVRFAYYRVPQKITAGIGDYNGTYGTNYVSLPSHTHIEIVDIAVRQAIATSQDPRYQLKVAEQQIKEQ